MLHLQLAPTGSVNDPSLARQTAKKQRTPENFLGLEGEGSPCTKASALGTGFKAEKMQLTCLLYIRDSLGMH